jgi:uncharacterized protein (DUF2336 family)
MSTYATLIDELETAVASGEIGRRANVMQRVTDLFVSNSGRLSDAQIAVFDDVMIRLLKETNDKARAKFGQLVAGLETAPPGIVRQLALDDSIEIAGPVLTRFDQIGADILVESATTKSQEHLLAISKRREIPESVTDVLVERGNQQVAVSTTENPGASFSEFGYATLVGRAETDGELAVCVWKRPGLPRQHLLTLFAAASETVQRELAAVDPNKSEEIKTLIARARNELQSHSREASPQYSTARAHVESLRDSGALSESRILTFARAKQFDETSIALSMMCDLPEPAVERAMTHSQFDQLLVLARSIGFSFQTVKAILSMRTEAADGSDVDLKQVSESFSKLGPETAKKTLQYYRLRARTILD